MQNTTEPEKNNQVVRNKINSKKNFHKFDNFRTDNQVKTFMNIYQRTGWRCVTTN